MATPSASLSPTRIEPLATAIDRQASPGATYLRRAGLRLGADGALVWSNSARSLYGGLRRALVASGALDAEASAEEALAQIVGTHWERMNYDAAGRLRDAMRARIDATEAPLSRSSVALSLSALRGVAREAFRLGLMDAEQLARAVEALRIKVHPAPPTGRDVAYREQEALFRACSDDAAGRRDAAFLALAFACGLRRAEAASVRVDDWHEEESGGMAKLTVQGKGGKTRTIYVANGALQAIRAWLAVRGCEPGPLLCPVAKGGSVQAGAPLTPQALYYRLRLLTQRSGVAHLTPHDARRTLAGSLLDKGIDLATVQGMLGHASPVTTARYDRRGDRAKQRAAASVSVPYEARTA